MTHCRSGGPPTPRGGTLVRPGEYATRALEDRTGRMRYINMFLARDEMGRFSLAGCQASRQSMRAFTFSCPVHRRRRRVHFLFRLQEYLP